MCALYDASFPSSSSMQTIRVQTLEACREIENNFDVVVIYGTFGVCRIHFFESISQIQGSGWINERQAENKYEK